MPEKIIFAQNEEMAARIRANKPGAIVQVRGAKKKSAETVAQRVARQRGNNVANQKHLATAQAERASQIVPHASPNPSLLHRVSGSKIPGGRIAVGAGLVGLSALAGYSAAKVKKEADKDTARRAVVGAGGLYGTYVGAGYAANVGTRHLSRKSKETNNAIRIHREKLGLPSGGFAGKVDPKKIEQFYRTLPTDVKFSGTRRVLARTHGGGRFGRLAAPVIAAGASGGLAYDQSKKGFVGNSVSKGTNVRDYPDLNENIRDITAYRIQRNPVSPLQALSAGILMARAQSAGRGQMLSYREVKRQGRSISNNHEYGMILNASAGHGVMV